MSDSLSDLVLVHLPEDGSAIGNGALIARLREIMPGSTDDNHTATKDVLFDEGIIGTGKGHGGSVFLTTESDDGNQNDNFELSHDRGPRAERPAHGSNDRGHAAQIGGRPPDPQISHTDTRVYDPDEPIPSSYVCRGLLDMVR